MISESGHTTHSRHVENPCLGFLFRCYSDPLSRPDCLDLPAAHTDRALTRRLAIDASGEGRSPPGFSRILRHSGAFFAALSGDLAGAAAAAQACFRTDLCRANLGPIGADPLGAS
jgi:hypothetical protein